MTSGPKGIIMVEIQNAVTKILGNPAVNSQFASSDLALWKKHSSELPELRSR